MGKTEGEEIREKIKGLISDFSEDFWVKGNNMLLEDRIIDLFESSLSSKAKEICEQLERRFEKVPKIEGKWFPADDINTGVNKGLEAAQSIVKEILENKDETNTTLR